MCRLRSESILTCCLNLLIPLALGSRGLPVRELTPNAIKKAVTGVTRVDKKQIQEMVRVILGLPEIPEPDHAADALGAAICAAHNTNSLTGT